MNDDDIDYTEDMEVLASRMQEANPELTFGDCVQAARRVLKREARLAGVEGDVMDTVSVYETRSA